MDKVIEVTGVRYVSVAHLIAETVDGGAQSTDLEHCDDDLKINMWARKLDHINPAFLDSVQREGIKTPIAYDPDSDELYNGHHRVVCAWLLNIDYLPFVDDFDESNSSDGPAAWPESTSEDWD